MEQFQLPKTAGRWIIGGNLGVYVKNRPGLIARFLCKLLLEWEWEDTDAKQMDR